MEVDAWAHPDGTCADAYPVAGRDAVVSFLTTFADGYQVATSNFQRSAVATGAGASAAWRAPRSRGRSPRTGRSGAARREPRRPAGRPDLDARLALARRFYAGIGASELRRPALLSLLNAALALLLLGSSLKVALRALGVLR